jgi:hypothetical protein
MALFLNTKVRQWLEVHRFEDGVSDTYRFTLVHVTNDPIIM